MLPSTIFLSYARNDSKVALKLASDLKAMDVGVWLDQVDIPPGERWDRAVEAALKRSTRLIVILSPASVASENVMDEVSYAIEEKKDIVPVIFEDCERPLRMRRFQFIDFTTDYASAFEKLLSLLNPASHSSQLRTGRATAPVPDETLSAESTAPEEAVARRQPRKEKASGQKKPAQKKAVTKDAATPTGKSSGKKQTKSSEMAVLDPTSSNSSFGRGKSITYNGHRIEMRFGLFIKILYDGEEVPSDSTTHYVFDVSEDGEDAHYEIFIMDNFFTWQCEVRRNGRTIFTDT